MRLETTASEKKIHVIHVRYSNLIQVKTVIMGVVVVMVVVVAAAVMVLL